MNLDKKIFLKTILNENIDEILSVILINFIILFYNENVEFIIELINL